MDITTTILIAIIITTLTFVSLIYTEKRTTRLIQKTFQKIRLQTQLELGLSKDVTLRLQESFHISKVNCRFRIESGGLFKRTVAATETDYNISIDPKEVTRLINHINHRTCTNAGPIIVQYLLYHDFRTIWQCQEQFETGRSFETVRQEYERMRHGQETSRSEKNAACYALKKIATNGRTLLIGECLIEANLQARFITLDSKKFDNILLRLLFRNY